jgi:flagellar basal-body rod protein FlgB
MSVTSADHMTPPDEGTTLEQDTESGPAEVQVSGNDVSLEDEFLKSGDVTRSYTMNTQIMKAFSRMLQSVTKA